MRNGKCPKCGSTTIHSQANGLLFAGRNEYIHLGMAHYPTDIVSFLCVSCGYFENYLSDPKKLAEAAQQWPKVPVTA